MNKSSAIKLSKIHFVFAVIMLLLSSCKALKTTNTQTVNKSNSIKELINLHYSKDFKFSTLESRLKIAYNDGKKSVSPSASLRIEKDKKIWLSIKFLGFTMAKAYITPQRVSFYEKLNKQYYEGDFKALSDFLGTKVDFNRVQNLLLGQSILELKNQAYNTNKDTTNQVLITPEKQDPLYHILLGLYADISKVSQLQVIQETEEESIYVEYPEYQKVADQDFPKSINILSKSKDDNKQIIVDYKTVQTNLPLSFPYTIPSGYTAHKLK